MATSLYGIDFDSADIQALLHARSQVILALQPIKGRVCFQVKDMVCGKALEDQEPIHRYPTPEAVQLASTGRNTEDPVSPALSTTGTHLLIVAHSI